MAAIWKDLIYNLVPSTGTDYVDYTISTDGVTTIYSGRAYKKPSDVNVIPVRVNDICADYLENVLPLEGLDYGYKAFTLTYLYNGTVVTNNFTFERDWSYDLGFDPANDAPVAPILDIVHPAQYLPVWGKNAIKVFSVRLNNGDFSNDFAPWYEAGHGDFLVFGGTTAQSVTNQGRTAFVDLSQYSGLEEVTANGKTFRVADLCGGFVLYYINAYGGWDSLPIQGRVVQSEGYTKYTHDIVYNNGTYPARGKHNYANEIARKYKFNIGPLTSAQAAKMWHLLGSTFVYLHDIENDRVLPVVLTATAAEIKDQRGVLHTYQVEASLAQERVRR